MKCLASCSERLALYLPCLVGMGVILPHYLVSREEWKNGAKLSHIWGHLVTSILSRAKNEWRLSNVLVESHRTFLLLLSIPISFWVKRCAGCAPPTPTRAKVAWSATRAQLKRCLRINHRANAPTQHSTGWNESFFMSATSKYWAFGNSGITFNVH